MGSSEVENLLAYINKKNIKSNYFDDLVHNTASFKASLINSGGLESQIPYLLENGWLAESIKNKMP